MTVRFEAKECGFKGDNAEITHFATPVTMTYAVHSSLRSQSKRLNSEQNRYGRPI